MSAAVKRACDACHRRKVKCDGINPCRNCHSSQLSCTYNAIPQKKGPKGSRAKVISELRETQRQTSLSAKVQNRLNGIAAPLTSPSLSPTPGLVTPEMAKESIEFYFAHLYTTMPIFVRRHLDHDALFLDQSLDTYCLVTALCAFTMFQPGMVMPGLDPVLDHIPGANIVSATLLLEEAIRVRKAYEPLDSPSVNTLCTAYLLFACHYALELHDKAWFYLREATTLAHIMGMSKEETYSQGDATQAARARRVYWQLFVTERSYALQRGRPMTLTPSINSPAPGDDPTDPLAHQQLSNFTRLVDLFRPFDDRFLSLWNQARNECSSAYLASLQKQACELLPSFMASQEIQQPDTRSIQQWLKAATWQFDPQQKPDDHMHYAVDMNRSVLMSMSSQFSSQNTEGTNAPLVAKLLDVSRRLIDVLVLQPSTGNIFSAGPREQLNSILQLLSVVRRGEHHLLPLLLSKAHECLPSLVNPMLQRAPDNAYNLDIFDGFGSAGMAQPALMTEFKAEPYTPASVSHIEEMVTDSTSSNGGVSAGADINSPYVSSPPMMSPGLEYHRMGDFGSMGDLINPASHHRPSLGHQHNQHPQGLGSQAHNVLQGDHALGQNQGMSNLGQQGLSQVQNYAHMNRGMVGGLMHRQQQPSQRANSFAMHQPAVGDFQSMQRPNPDTMSMDALNMNAMGTEMDFTGLR